MIKQDTSKLSLIEEIEDLAMKNYTINGSRINDLVIEKNDWLDWFERTIDLMKID